MDISTVGSAGAGAGAGIAVLLLMVMVILLVRLCFVCAWYVVGGFGVDGDHAAYRLIRALPFLCAKGEHLRGATGGGNDVRFW